jgi:zinc/manganese transport system substrate-binding protein
VAHRPRPQPPSPSRLATRHRRSGSALVAVIAGLLALLSFPTAAGASSTTAPKAGPTRINVVAAENFWGSIVRQLAGSHATVTSIITNPATDPHSYEAKPSDSRAIAGANYVIVNGIGYDPWAQKALDASPSSGRKVLIVGDLLGLHDGDNPHQWYSPESVQAFIDRVTADLQRLDPRDARAFDALRTQFETVGLGQYHAVIAAIRQKYAGTPVGASESIVSPLAASLGLKVLTPSSFLKAIAEGTDPSAADKETVDQQVKAKQIKVFVFNSQNSTPDVQAIIKEAKARAIPVTTVTETLAPANATFQAWQVKELRALQAALAKATGS